MNPKSRCCERREPRELSVVAVLPVCRRRVRVSGVVVVVVSFLLPLSLPALRYSSKGGESNYSTTDDVVIVDDRRRVVSDDVDDDVVVAQ